MKRYFVALAAACALTLTLATGPAFAGGLVPKLPVVGQTVSNVTDQSNEATAVNVPIASGNNVALVNGGDQTASAGTTQEQSNQNATYQDADQSSKGGSSNESAGRCGCSQESGSQDQSVSNETNQSNEATAINVPIASGNNVALVNGGDQTASAGTTQEQSNQNATKQEADQSGSGSYGKGGQEQSVSNETNQSNEATAINVPILSGNNVALVNGGDQTASAGTTQEQSNRNATKQEADQSGSAGKHGQKQWVSNETGQRNEATAVNVPIASGNNVALVNGVGKGDGCGCSKSEGGDQTASAGTTQKQENANLTKQEVDQSSWSGTKSKRSKQVVSNETYQSNEATAVNVPIASGNNLALVNGGDQTASAGTTQKQENVNYTKQEADQDTYTRSDNRDYGKAPYDRHESKPCPKPEPKPCPKPEPKPKPCPPKPCQPKPECKPCPPKPCERGANERQRTVREW